MAQLNFNTQEVAPDAGGKEPWPEGWHLVIITDSDIAESKKEGSRNAYLKLTVASANGSVFGTQDLIFNLFNDNADAVRIAKGQLTKLCHVLGKTQMVGDSRELHNIPFQVLMQIQKGDRGTLNRFRDFKFADGRELPKPGAMAAHVPPGAVPNSAPPTPPAPPNGQGYAPPQPGGFGAPPAPPQGQPQYGATPPVPPQPPQGGQPAYGAPPPPPQAPQYGQAPAPGYAPQPPAPPQPGYAPQPPAPPQPGYGAPPQPPGAYGQPPQAPQGGFAAPPGHQPWGGPQQ